jgi:hypothetical protein
MRVPSAVTMLRLAARAVFFALVGAQGVDAQVAVVNMIPVLFGNETQWNPEPTLAVHPTDRSLLAASTFLLGTDVCENSSVSPILVSRDTGMTWSMVCALPTPGLAGLPPGDVSLRWGVGGRRLYASLVWGTPQHPLALQLLATNDIFAPGPMTTLLSKDFVDQPDLLVFNHAGHDRVMVAASYKDTMPQTGGILWADDPQPGTAFQRVFLERRKISGQNYAVRIAAHEGSGRVYALYNGGPKEKKSDNPIFLDIAVARDDSAGASHDPFAALLETKKTPQPVRCPTGDGKPGVRVARCRPFPNDSIELFGFERRVPVQLSVSTDPTDAAGNRVYIAWCDSLGSARLQTTLAMSADGGQTWRTLLTVPSATNPSVAVDSTGRIGVLFQQLAPDSTTPRWVTRLLVSRDQMQHARSYTLADTPAQAALVRTQPYIGDWVEVHASGNEFVGVFAAANMPDTTNFPNGVKFQRIVLLEKKFLISRSPLLGAVAEIQVAPSIDPFFFRVGPIESAECSGLRASLGRGAAAPSLGTPPRRITNPNVRRMMQIGCDFAATAGRASPSSASP